MIEDGNKVSSNKVSLEVKLLLFDFLFWSFYMALISFFLSLTYVSLLRRVLSLVSFLIFCQKLINGGGCYKNVLVWILVLFVVVGGGERYDIIKILSEFHQIQRSQAIFWVHHLPPMSPFCHFFYNHPFPSDVLFAWSLISVRLLVVYEHLNK